MACTVEIDRIGKPIGKQDQYAAAFGGIIVLKIGRDGSVDAVPLNLHSEVIRDFENHLMMFYTEIERDANEILAAQCEKLKQENAKTVEQDGEGSEKKETDAVRAMHEIKEIGYRSKNALESGAHALFGKLMHRHWEIKKTILNTMSNSKIDAWYDIAMNSGAIGGKIMGAGGGGFFLFCVENGKRKTLRRTLENAGLRYMDFRFDFEGSKVIANV
jgi:D-glycero-alpha-D-manno-heptose-7-phosphate kinase